MALGKAQSELIDELRRLLARQEQLQTLAALPFNVPEIDAHLGQRGLIAPALHEIMPALARDTPAAFAFIVALLSRLPSSAPSILILSPRGLAGYGRPSGHGLNGFGFDPGCLLLVDAQNEKQALSAIEECLCSGAPAAVAGAIGTALDLKTSQRLQFSARQSGIPLLLMPLKPGDASAAETRWHISALPAARDRFGLLLKSRWKVKLDRCRNGRPGEWCVEWDHATHRFSLAAALADSAVFHSTDPDVLCTALHRS